MYTDHDLCISRYNRRTGNPYIVWVKVTSYAPAEALTHNHPGYAGEIEDADAWTSRGDEIELTRDELVEATELWEQNQRDAADDARAEAEDHYRH